MNVVMNIVLLSVFVPMGIMLLAITPMVVIAAYRDLIKGGNK
jgi:hypothetical protein